MNLFLKRFSIFLFLAVLVFFSGCQKKGLSSQKKDPLTVTHKVVVQTNEGNMTLALFGEGMPVTVKNFLEYVEGQFYDGLIFHRVIQNFVIQGGGFSPELVQKETKPAIKLEMAPFKEVVSESGQKSKKLLITHEKYALAMARTRDPHSATSQFYITLSPQKQLDPNPEYNEPNGYAVFGKVIEGFEIVDKIGFVEVGQQKNHGGVPKVPVVIEKMFVLREEEKK
ncbi:MAG: peptidylprolyl isomerase [bacterium]